MYAIMTEAFSIQWFFDACAMCTAPCHTNMWTNNTLINLQLSAKVFINLLSIRKIWNRLSRLREVCSSFSFKSRPELSTNKQPWRRHLHRWHYGVHSQFPFDSDVSMKLTCVNCQKEKKKDGTFHRAVFWPLVEYVCWSNVCQLIDRWNARIRNINSEVDSTAVDSSAIQHIDAM